MWRLSLALSEKHLSEENHFIMVKGLGLSQIITDFNHFSLSTRRLLQIKYEKALHNIKKKKINLFCLPFSLGKADHANAAVRMPCVIH